MKKSIIVLLGLFFLLTACATSGPSRFERSNISSEIMQGDLTECTAEATSTFKEVMAFSLIGLATKDERKAWEIEKCMVAKGYRCTENCNRGTGKEFTGK